MKKNVLLAFVAILISTLVYAQVSTTPEVPRNYKPKPKELLPMPDSLTTEDIFPVLGKYSLADKDGDSTDVFISLDPESKGVVWVSGLADGKFKAELKASPATYKIPSQKTFANDATTGETPASVEEAEGNAVAPAKKLSGKSVNEGTLFYDKEANQIYINLGSKFNETDPTLVFDHLKPEPLVDDVVASVDEKPRKKKSAIKGKNYVGAKIPANSTEM